MAGVFKSLDKSDVRITPFRTHKVWSENLGYQYTAGSTFNTLPSIICSLQNRGYSNYVYTVDELMVRKIDVSDDYTELINLDLANVGWDGLVSTFEVPSFGPASNVILGGLSGGKVAVGFVDSDLNAEDNIVDGSTYEIYQLVSGWDYITPNDTFYTFACTDTGLYSCPMRINDGLPATPGGDWTQHNDVAFNNGAYFASTPYVYGQTTASVFSVYVQSADSKFSLTSHAMETPNSRTSGWTQQYYVDTDTSVTQQISTTVKKFFVMHGAVDILWTLFEDGNLWVCRASDGLKMRRVATNIADIQTDYDLIYNPDYSVQPIPTTTTFSRKLYIIDKAGMVFVNATYNNLSGVVSYEAIVDCRQYVGPQNTVTKTFITKNTDTPILGIYVNGGVQQSTLITMNTKTYELSDPVYIGTLKNNVIFEADNKTDNVYAMRSASGSLQYYAPGSISAEHWYKFTI